MDFLLSVIDFILHIDRHLGMIIDHYSFWTHLFLFAIIFLETGFIVTPFLPGDSLLFATGAFCALGSLGLTVTTASLATAAVLGDTVNYWAGRKVRPKVFSRESSRFFNKKHLEQTHAFYVRHGGKTIIIARFIPIIRTFAPFVAGIGSMPYARFLSYNVVGGIAWVAAFLLMGYVFGNMPIVKDRFGLVILVIIVISVLPAIITYVRSRRGAAERSCSL
jgi:membrane-associated protein